MERFVRAGSGNVLIYKDGALTAHGVTEIRGNHRAELANHRDQIPRLFLSFEPCLLPPPCPGPSKVDQTALYRRRAECGL